MQFSQVLERLIEWIRIEVNFLFNPLEISEIRCYHKYKISVYQLFQN